MLRLFLLFFGFLVSMPLSAQTAESAAQREIRLQTLIIERKVAEQTVRENHPRHRELSQAIEALREQQTALSADEQTIVRDALRQQEVDALLTLEQLRLRYGEAHPQIRDARTRLTAIRDALKALEPNTAQSPNQR